MVQLALTAVTKQPRISKNSIGYLATSIQERRSQELVFTLVGPLGSGCTTTANELSEILRSDYRYAVPKIITISEIIKDGMNKMGKTPPNREDGIDTYISEMQDAGNDLRSKFGTTYLIEKAIEVIYPTFPKWPAA